MTVNEAVRELRKHRVQTQQHFATELGISISGLQNYERDQMPEPRQLSIFRECAHRSDRPDLVQVFGEALQRSLGVVGYSSFFYPKVRLVAFAKGADYSFSPKSVEALRRCLSGHADYADVAPLVIQAVAETIEGLAEREHDPARVKQFRAIRPKIRRKDK